MHIVMEELVSTVVAPKSGNLAQQHIILVVLAHGQSRHLQKQFPVSGQVAVVTVDQHKSLVDQC